MNRFFTMAAVAGVLAWASTALLTVSAYPGASVREAAGAMIEVAGLAVLLKRRRP